MLFTMLKKHNIFFWVRLSQINGFIRRGLPIINQGLGVFLYKAY